MYTHEAALKSVTVVEYMIPRGSPLAHHLARTQNNQVSCRYGRTLTHEDALFRLDVAEQSITRIIIIVYSGGEEIGRTRNAYLASESMMGLHLLAYPRDIITRYGHKIEIASRR